MARTLPPLDWFRTFDSAARHASFTRAAAELNVTQSAVSQHIRSLEQRLGAPLFVRKARGVALTDAGRRLQSYVASAMADLATATGIFSHRSGENLLEIACSVSFARLWLCREVGTFLAANPDVSIRIMSAVWPDEYLRVKADVQIRYGSSELVGDGAVQLLADSVVPICHPALAQLDDPNGLPPSLPLINVLGTENTWDRWCRATGVSLGSASRLYVDSDELAVELAECQMGLALCGRFLCQHLIDKGRLCTPIPGEMPSRDNYYVAVAETQGPDGPASRFEAWLLHAAAAYRPGTL